MLQIPIQAQKYFQPRPPSFLMEVRAYVRRHHGWPSLRTPSQNPPPPSLPVRKLDNRSAFPHRPATGTRIAL